MELLFVSLKASAKTYDCSNFKRSIGYIFLGHLLRPILDFGSSRGSIGCLKYLVTWMFVVNTIPTNEW